MSGTFGDRDAVIIDSIRSPIGRAHKGSLIDFRPDDLAAVVVRELLDRHPAAEQAGIDELICGCGYPWGEQGFNVGRAIALLAGLPDSTPAYTLSRLCASSLQALRSAHHAILAGEADALVVCGVESVSRVGRDRDLAPLNPRLDATQPGATRADLFLPMIATAERVADQFAITREEMDAFGQRSQERAVAAQDSGFFDREIVAVRPPTGAVAERDDGPRRGSSPDALAALRPVQEGGRVTAGNASPLNDGAAAALVLSGARAAELGLRPRARIVASAVSALDPTIMGMGPVEAVRRVLPRAGIELEEIDVIELNEAFAAQVIPVMRSLGSGEHDERLNPHGGAIALGHPFGMTGVRMMTTLLNGLDAVDGRWGLETMCVGGGQGQAMVVERLT